LEEIIMPAWSTIGIYALAALGVLLLPGPAVLYITTRSATQGRRAGFASVGGVELATLTHAVAAALGLSALLLTSALAFSVVKYVGAAYLIYLGLRTLFVRETSDASSAPVRKPLSQLFASGYLVNLLNPKAAIFFYAFLPQFVDPARGAVVGQTLLFGVLFVLLASCTDSCYALLGATVGRWFAGNKRVRRSQRYATGGVYIILGLAAAVAGSEKK
jgi:threonine/homoserine/homoserine lactone efflux protein